jgi:hypothetical protein
MKRTTIGLAAGIALAFSAPTAHKVETRTK